MDNLDKIFKGQQSNEEYICFFRHHWVTLVKEFIYFGIFLVIVGFVFAYANEIQNFIADSRELKLFFFTVFLAGTVFLHRFFLHFLNYFINVGIITNIRVIDHQRTLFLHDTMEAVDLAQIQNIERMGEGFFPNFLHFGDIKIFLNASDAVITFKTIPNVKFHFRCISRQKEERQNALREILQTQQREHQNIIEEVDQTINSPISREAASSG